MRERHPAVGDRRVLRHAEHVLHPHATRSGARRCSRSVRCARWVASTTTGPARPARCDGDRPTGCGATSRGRRGRDRRGRSRRRGRAGASRRARRSGRGPTSRASRHRARREAGRPGHAAATARSGHDSTASFVFRTLVIRASSVSSPGSGAADLLAEPERVESALDPHHEIVAVGVPQRAGGPRRRRRARRRSRTPRPRRRAGSARRDRLPSTSAATRNSASASGSSSATQAPDPVRIWNWPRRRLAARRSGNPASSSSPARSGSTESGSKRTADPACQVGRPLANAPHAPAVGAVVGDVPADDRDTQPDVGRQLVDPAAHHVPLVEDRGDDARRRHRRAGDDPGKPGMQRQVDHRAPEVGEPPVGVDGAEHRQQVDRFAPTRAVAEDR